MKLISAVEIRGFRSIRSCRIEGLGDFAAFAGLNNSGKSNVLRALNAFFNGETGEGVPLNVDADYYRPDLKKKKAKEITVAVAFSLPNRFRFRKWLEAAHDLLGGNDFTITKRWRRNQPTPTYLLRDDELDLDQRQLVDQFLQLIKFRYMPNRVLPIEVVRQEHQALRDVLVRRLGSRAGTQTATFTAIRDTSEKIISALARRMHAASPDIGEVRLATPTSWSDMVFAFGYKLSRDGIEMEDALQGAGVQSLLMLETLYLIDRDYFQKFGWRQAAVWAVEEPESSLHASLEARVAAYLADIANDPASRLQVLCTTHSDVMLQYASRVFVIRKDGWETKAEAAKSAPEAIDSLSREGISHWAHPILVHPLEPLILVEGKYDASFLQEAFKLLRPYPAPRIAYLGLLQGGDKTGGSELYNYIRDNVRVIRVRPTASRVVIVLDWDSASKKAQFEKIAPKENPFSVLVWSSSTFNPKLGKDFRGIERTFSDRLIRQAIQGGAPIDETQKGGFVVTDKDQYGRVKDLLRGIVEQGLQTQDLQHARSFLKEVCAATGARV